MIFPLEEGPVSQTGEFQQCLNSFYGTDSPLRVTNIARNGNVVFQLTSLNDFPLEEGQVSQAGEFKQILDSFYDTDSPLCVTIIAEMAMF